MISRTIKFVDWDNKAVERTFWFNLTEIEIAEIALADDLEEIQKAQDIQRTFQAFRRIMRASAIKREGQKMFRPEHYGDEFVASDAYSRLILGFLEEGETNGIKDLREFVEGIKNVDADRIKDMPKPQDHLQKRMTLLPPTQDQGEEVQPRRVAEVVEGEVAPEPTV